MASSRCYVQRMANTSRQRRRPLLPSEIPTPPEEGRLALTVAEVAWLLHMSTRGVYDLIYDGSLPSFKLGRRRLVARHAVETLMETEQQVAEG